VIGDYDRPTVRLPGAGGAPEIAGSAGEVFIVLRQTQKTFVDRLDFVTSVGHGEGGDYRKRIGLLGGGPAAVITDLGILRPHPTSKELTLTNIHPGVAIDQVRAMTGWSLSFSSNLEITPAPTSEELAVLRDLEQRTATAHGVTAV
jgi:glutaconate CoA-transferase subunit B